MLVRPSFSYPSTPPLESHHLTCTPPRLPASPAASLSHQPDWQGVMQNVLSCRMRSKAPYNSKLSGPMLSNLYVNICYGMTHLDSAPKSALKLLFFVLQRFHAQWDWSWNQRALYQGLKSDKGPELQGTEVTSGWHSSWNHCQPAAESRFPKSHSSASAFVPHAIHLGFVSKKYSACTWKTETAKLNRSWFRWECPSRTIGAIYKKCTRCSV